MVNFTDLYNYILNKCGSRSIRVFICIVWYLILIPSVIYLSFVYTNALTVISAWLTLSAGAVLPMILADYSNCNNGSLSSMGYPEVPVTLNEKEYGMNDNKNILMGRDNPEGYKLEDLLDKLVSEVETKITYIESDPRVEAKQVVCNNNQIIGLLQQAAALQRMSYAVLDNMSTNEGPLGRYRIGTQKED